MPGLVEIAWLIYTNSGPALNLVFIGMVVLGWKYEIQPRLDALEDTQDDHGDSLQERNLNATERDILLENAHDRLDNADEARTSLRQRLTRLENAVAHEIEGNPDDHGIGPADRQTRADGRGDD